ncbi:MAG: formylglycine-generating enzyme family protein [Alteromonadaceae bacterium]|nr:formylglycine-generating enzyme family protein [Alteromonadaceae bacterium]
MKVPFKSVALLSTFLLGCSATADKPAYVVGQSFQDCENCPKMIVVPAGQFMMGSGPDEKNRGKDEQPVYQVTLPRPFAVGIYEITFNQWQACLDEQGCNGYMPHDAGWGRGERPVMNVSWQDAKDYLQWLSNKTGHQYRLLTESEWEYVARGGTSALYWWGDDRPKGKAVCARCDADNSQMTQPVGSYLANPFGLHDVHGNVWEWVEDCWSKDYKDHYADGTAWTGKKACKRRVVRGGAWSNGGRHLRSANRSWKSPAYRGLFENGIGDYSKLNGRGDFGKGIRVAMTLPLDK